MLSYTRTGTAGGPAVVFLHGGGISSWMWTSVTEKLPGLNCILVDLPGHGKSRDVPWRSIEQTAGDVWALLDRGFSGSDINLVGLSLGSYVGLQMMAERPEAVSAAVLSGMHGGGMKSRWMMKAMATLMAPLTVRPVMTRRVAKMFGLTGGDVETFAKEAAKTRVSAAARAVCQVVDHAPPAGTSAITTRTLFVAGDKEHALILSSLPLLAASLAHSRAATAPGVGHGWAGENPELFARTVSAWIDGTALPGELTRVDEPSQAKDASAVPGRLLAG